MHQLFERVKHLKGPIVAVAAVGAVLSGLAGYWTTYRTVTGAPIATPVVAKTRAGALSIMVLPFANQTGDAQKTYVADALTTTVTADLSRLTDAYVVPTATAMAFRDKPLTVHQVGAETGVRFVLQGSVLSSGEKVRLGVQLSDTQSGALLWQETVEGELTNLFALQDRVTTSIGNSIRREMVIRAARESETRKTSPAAADLVLRAQALALKPRSLANFAQVESLYRQVLVLEPDNVSAMHSLAGVLAVSANNFVDAMTPTDRESKDFLENKIVPAWRKAGLPE